MANVILIRHPKTALNRGTAPGESDERIRGWAEIPLDKTGKREAIALAAEHSHNIGKVYTSDLGRARVTALEIARAAKVPVVKTEQLRPWALGALTGKRVGEVIPLMNKLVEHPDVKVPDGEVPGESFNDFSDRYLPFLSGVISDAAAAPKDVVVVTHSRNLQLYRAWDKAGRPDDFSYDVPRMLDYRDEVPPAGHIVVKPRG